MRGIQALGAGAFDVIVAVGGGSALDMAKLVNVLAHQEQPPVESSLMAARQSRSAGCRSWRSRRLLDPAAKQRSSPWFTSVG